MIETTISHTNYRQSFAVFGHFSGPRYHCFWPLHATNVQ